MTPIPFQHCPRSPKPEAHTPLPRPVPSPDWTAWIRARLAEKGALLEFPSESAFPDPGASANVYHALDTGVLYRWDGSHYQVLVDPSAANDVLEYGDRGEFPGTGEHGKLYIAADTGSLYRWGGEDYAELLPGKADKAVPQAAGNFAALAQDGNLMDSGKKPADYEFESSPAGTWACTPAATQYGTPFSVKWTVDPTEGEGWALFTGDTKQGRVLGDASSTELSWSPGAGTAFYDVSAVRQFSGTEYHPKGQPDVKLQPAGDYVAWSDVDDTPTMDSPNPVTSDGIAKAVAVVDAKADAATGQIAGVKSLIPSGATARNHLVDKATMNSSIATNTANFLGTYSYVTDLHFPQPSSAADVDNDAIALALGSLTYEQTPTNNDYVFVSINYTPTTDVDEFRRFKFNSTTGTWAYEYTLNNSAFTTDQWAAINSGITSGAVAKIDALPTAQSLAQSLAGKLDKSGGIVTGPVLINSENAATVGPLTLGFNVDPEHVENSLDIIRDSNGDIYLRIRDTTLSGIVQQRLPRTSGVYALLSDINTAIQQIAPAWVSGTAYPAYAFCSYNGVVYQNGSTAIPSGTTTTPDTSGSGWTAKPVSDLFLPLTGGTLTGGLGVPYIAFTAGSGNSTFGYSSAYNGFQFDVGGIGSIVIRPDASSVIELNAPKTNGSLALTAGTGHNGNLAALDANGNPTDSGVKASDKLDSTSAAPAFSTSSTYAVDEHVTYNGKLYRCTTAVTTAGAWDASKWTLDDMTTPDATLDVTAAKQLRVVATDGTVLWAQGYDLASASSVTLSNEALNLFAFAANTAVAFSDATAYAAGDKVVYDGRVYVFTAAHAAGAWIGTDAEVDAQAFTLPTPPSGKVGDYVLDVDNTANAAVSMSASLSGLGTTFNVVVPVNENLTDMLTFAPGAMAELYFTQTAFTVGGLPAWKIVRQDVEAAV